MTVDQIRLIRYGVQVLLLTAILYFYGCQPVQPYQYIQSPNGQTMVVVHDNGNDILLEAAAFQMLMNQGGYSNVITHYHSYNYVPYSGSYRTWRTMPARWSPPPSTYSGATAPPRSDGFRRNDYSTKPTMVNTTPSAPRTSGFRRPDAGSVRPTFIRTSSSSTVSRASGFRRR